MSMTTEANRFNPRPLASPYGGRSFGIRYPSPFFDVAQQFLPTNVHQLQLWCRYYFFTNPVINAAVSKMSEFPVTPIIYEGSDEVIDRYQTLEKLLRLRAFQVEVGLDYWTYGNCFVSVSFPFLKFLVCRSCKERHQAEKSRAHYKWRNMRFQLKCRKCGHEDVADERDVAIRSLHDIRLVRWNPENIEIKYNEITGKSKHFFKIPKAIINDITMGEPDVIETLPIAFLDAARKGKALVFHPDNFYHLKRPSLAEKDQGWGTPLIYPVLKDAFYTQVMKKGQEAILMEHIVPLRVVFPGQTSGGNDGPFGSYNLQNWKAKVDYELSLWKRDCVTPETWIETGSGLRQARDVREGDLLKNHEGGLSRVLTTWRRPLREDERTYKIVARGLHAVQSIYSENHPLLITKVLDRGHGHRLKPESSFVKAKDVQVRDYVGYPVGREVEPREHLDLAEYSTRAVTADWVYIDHKEQAVPEAFEFITEMGCPEDRKGLLEEKGWSLNHYKTAQIALREKRTLRRVPRFLPFDEELAWVVGIYLAEGNTGAKQVLFSLHEEEQHIIDRLNRFFIERFGAEEALICRKSEHGIQIIFSSLVAAEFFHSLAPGDSRTKEIPACFMHAEAAFVVRLLEGLFEGDGCFHEDGYSKKASYRSSSMQMAEGARQLLMSIGVPTGISYEEPHETEICGKASRSNGAYTLSLGNSQKQRLLGLFEGKDLPLHDVRLGVFRDGYFWHRIEAVEQVEAEEVIGFQTDSTEASAHLAGDPEAHGTFCTWGMATANCNYIPIFPVNVGFQQWGGTAKALIMHNEFRVHYENMLSGMGVPPEFVFGGLNWSPSNTALRALENTFLGYNKQRHELVNDFILGRIADFMQWPKVKSRFDRFKMADDLQRSMFYLQLNQAQKISDVRLLEELGEDHGRELERMTEELKRQGTVQRKMQTTSADIQGEVMLRTSRYQAKAQALQMQAQMAVQQEAAAAGGAPMAGAPPGGQPPAEGQPGAEDQQQVGPDGQPIPTGPQPPSPIPNAAAPAGQQLPPGMPEGATAYADNADRPNDSKLPPGFSSYLQTGAGGVDLTYMAQRAASYLRTVQKEMGEEAMQQELEKMKMANPQLAQLVQQLLGDSGSKVNPMSAAKAPAPGGTVRKDPSRTIG